MIKEKGSIYSNLNSETSMNEINWILRRPKGNGFSGITLAYNVEHKEDVDSVIELVRNAGGRIVKEPQDTFWGGYHAYFSDLDGYYWEVAWGSNFQFDENGLLKF